MGREVWQTRWEVVADLADPASPITELAAVEVARGSAAVRQVADPAMA